MVATPEITPVSPSPGETDVERQSEISFTTSDNAGVEITSICAYVQGVLIYSGVPNTFAEDWEASYFVANSSNGYDFTLVPNMFAKFDLGEIVTVRVYIQDTVGNEAEEVWQFTVETISDFKLRIYPMIVASMRRHDEMNEQQPRTQSDLTAASTCGSATVGTSTCGG